MLFTGHYASPSSGEAYRDRRLTTNFELWVEIFCVPTCFHMRIPKPCLSVHLSVCPHPEKIYRHSFVNISPTFLIDTSMERSSRVLHHGNIKIWFFFSKQFEIEFGLAFCLTCFLFKFEIEFWLIFWLVPKRWNHSSRSLQAPIWWHRGCIVVPSGVDI